MKLSKLKQDFESCHGKLKGKLFGNLSENMQIRVDSSEVRTQQSDAALLVSYCTAFCIA